MVGLDGLSRFTNLLTTGLQIICQGMAHPLQIGYCKGTVSMISLNQACALVDLMTIHFAQTPICTEPSSPQTEVSDLSATPGVSAHCIAILQEVAEGFPRIGHENSPQEATSVALVPEQTSPSADVSSVPVPEEQTGNLPHNLQV